MSPVRLDTQGVSEIEPPSPLLGGAANGCLMSAERKFGGYAGYFPCAPISAIRVRTAGRLKPTQFGHWSERQMRFDSTKLRTG